MKYLIRVFAMLAFVLTSCLTFPENIPADTTTDENISKNSIKVVGGDDASLRKFIEQWLFPLHPDTAHEITVYIGSMPKNFPYDLPLPNDANIVGSIAGYSAEYELLLDTNLTPEEIQEFYAVALVEKGWHVAPSSPDLRGFISQADIYSVYCTQENKSSLRVGTPFVSETKRGIRLSLDTTIDTYAYMCEDSNAGQEYAYEKLIPQLKAPNGTWIQTSNYNSSDGDMEITADIYSTLSPADLIKFYNQQLLEAGWQMQNTDNNGGQIARSNWTLKDEQGRKWHGSLTISKTTTESGFLITVLRIEKAK